MLQTSISPKDSVMRVHNICILYVVYHIKHWKMFQHIGIGFEMV